MVESAVEVSAIIPTLNHREVLARAVASVRRQSLPNDQYELIVVDNGSEDDTRALVERLNQDGAKRVRYVYEGRRGLHYARHAGADAAKGSLLVFTDDDVTCDSGWLGAHLKAFNAHPEMAAAGGAIRPSWESPPPQWLLEYIGEAKIFGILSLFEPFQDFRLDPRGMFFGTNLAIRRDVLFEVGGFNPESFGEMWLGDGETGLNRKLWAQSRLVGYVPDALVYHHIPRSRMTVEYFCRRMANEAACTEYGRFRGRVPGPVGLSLRLVRISMLSVPRLGLVTLLRVLLQRDRTAVLKARVGLAYQLSRLRYVRRLFHDQQLRALVSRSNWLNSPSRAP